MQMHVAKPSAISAVVPVKRLRLAKQRLAPVLSRHERAELMRTMLHDVLTLASAMAYTLVFSLIPLLATPIAFFTAFPGLADARKRVLDLLFSQLLPGAVRGVSEYLEQFSDRAAAAGVVSSLIFMVLVLVLFQSVESAFNRIWHVERGRTWGKRISALAMFLPHAAFLHRDAAGDAGSAGDHVTAVLAELRAVLADEPAGPPQS